jgi:sodium-independent sulfate anion transporter 11
MESGKRIGKRIIGYPETIVPVVDAQDWISQYTTNPRQRVRNVAILIFFCCSTLVLLPSLLTISLGYSPCSPGFRDTVIHRPGLDNPRFTQLPLDFGWLTGDVIAGLTVGMVVVPQGMSYAQVRRFVSNFVTI